MALLTHPHLAPAVAVNQDHQPRRVGVEIEFGELTIETAADAVADALGSELIKKTDYEYLARHPELGDFKIEVDLSLLKRMGQTRLEADEEPGTFEQMSEELLAAVARQWVPCEVITPPLRFEHMAMVDQIVGRLREVGAKGTTDALFYAFGVHFNPEVPSLKADCLLRYLRAFAVLYEWLRIELQVDTARRLSPFIKPFPEPYVRLIIDPDYQPDIAGLIDNYLLHNPTRNRALDMLPVFAWIDRDRVTAVVKSQLVSARPTFHYRLPHSQVGDTFWRITDEWRYWLIVEGLANNPDKLDAICADYLLYLDRPLGEFFTDWADKVRQWLTGGATGR